MESPAGSSPNILLLVEECESRDCSTWRSELEACLGTERSTVYSLSAADVTEAPWKQSCKCLMVPAGIVLNQACLKELLTFVCNGGRCLSTNDTLNRELLGRSLVPQDDADSRRPFEVRPVNSDLDSFMSCRVPSSSMQETSSANALEWEVSTLAHLCLESTRSNSERCPCVLLLEHNNGNRRSLSCVISAVELLSPPQFASIAKAHDIVKVKEGLPARLKFLRLMFEQLGVKGGVDVAVSLSLTYMICRSEEVC